MIMLKGRSAFESLPDESLPEEPPTQDGILALQTPTRALDELDTPFTQRMPFVETPIYRQQYDNRGHPENRASRERSRRSRRAMNDVLATVGVCIGVNADHRRVSIGDRRKPGLDRAKIDDISTENTLGLIIDSIDLGLISVAGMAIMGLRSRLQTFRFYSGIPMTEVLKCEWKHLGIIKLLFLGMPASLMYNIVIVAKAWAIETFVLDAASRVARHLGPPEKLNILRSAVQVPKALLHTITFAILAPLGMFSTLQRLDLLPGWPWLPHPRVFIPFTASSPLQLPRLQTSFTLSSITALLASIATSPLLLWWVLATTRPLIDTKVRAYIRAAIPKPYKPDRYSLEAAKEDELDNDSIPGLCNAPYGDRSEWESASFREELAKDLQKIGRNFQILYDRFANFFARYPKSPSDEADDQQHTTIQNPRPNLPNTFHVPSQSTSSSSTSNASTPSLSRRTTPDPPIEIAPSDSDDSPGTIRIQAPVPNQNRIGDRLDSIFQNPDEFRDTNSPLHRITALTAYAADSFAHHLSSHLVDILFLPLEALFVRSLATNFLSSPRANPSAQEAAARWKSEVFPLNGWCGMGFRGGWRGVGDYAGKMVLIFGMEMGISFTVWQICTRFAWVSGRRMFEWGRL